MNKPKWYNWTGNEMWDDYCRVAWIIVIIPGLTLIALLILGIATGFIEVVG
jgi:hypothetical protein